MRRTGTMMRWLRQTIAALGLALALGLPLGALGPGCAAPTLPLPPPTALSTAPDAEGYVTVTGMVRPGALVFVIDEDRGDGVIVTADDAGAYTARLLAMTGDTLVVFAREGTSDSSPRYVIVPEF